MRTSSIKQNIDTHNKNSNKHFYLVKIKPQVPRIIIPEMKIVPFPVLYVTPVSAPVATRHVVIVTTTHKPRSYNMGNFFLDTLLQLNIIRYAPSRNNGAGGTPNKTPNKNIPHFAITTKNSNFTGHGESSMTTIIEGGEFEAGGNDIITTVVLPEQTASATTKAPPEIPATINADTAHVTDVATTPSSVDASTQAGDGGNQGNVADGNVNDGAGGSVGEVTTSSVVSGGGDEVIPGLEDLS
jgi:hypothetical protein